MLLAIDFKNQDSSIRRKAYNVNNPVQAERSSGYERNVQPINPEAGWTPTEFLEVGVHQ